jgi:hypothetical protein
LPALSKPRRSFISKEVPSSRKSLFHDEEILKENPHYKDLYRILLTARPRLCIPDYPRISSVIQKNVSAVLVGIEPPATAALRMDRTRKPCRRQDRALGKKIGP